MKAKTYKIDGLDCAECAAHLEKKICQLEDVNQAQHLTMCSLAGSFRLV